VSSRTARYDPKLVPSYLRPHLVPSVRRLYLDVPNKTPRTVTSTTEIAIENFRLHAEIDALRTNCEMWRKRAEVHGSAILGLLRLVRVAREEVAKVTQERDQVPGVLKRKVPDDESVPHSHTASDPPKLSGTELPSMASIYKEELARFPMPLPPSLSRRPQPNIMSAEECDSPRPIKRARLDLAEA